MADPTRDLRDAASSLERAAETLLASPQQQQHAQSVLQSAQQTLATQQTPGGQALGSAQYGLAERLSLARTELDLARERVRMAYLMSPQGSMMAQAQLSMQLQRGAVSTRADTARIEAETQYLRTPQGQAQVVAQHQAEKERTQAERRQELAREDALAGGSRAIPRFVDGLTAAGKQLFGFIGTLQQVQNFALGVAARASPQVVATYQGSVEMLMSRLGGSLLPLIERASREVQNKVDFLDSPTGKGWLQQAGNVASAIPEAARFASPVGAAFGGFKWINRGMEAVGLPNIGKEIGGQKTSETWRWLFGEQEEKPLKRSLAGLPQAQISDAESYYDRLTTSALNTDDIQADLLRQQLSNLEKIVGLLEQTEGVQGRINQSFR